MCEFSQLTSTVKAETDTGQFTIGDSFDECNLSCVVSCGVCYMTNTVPPIPLNFASFCQSCCLPYILFKQKSSTYHLTYFSLNLYVLMKQMSIFPSWTRIRKRASSNKLMWWYGRAQNRICGLLKIVIAQKNFSCNLILLWVIVGRCFCCCCCC